MPTNFENINIPNHGQQTTQTPVTNVPNPGPNNQFGPPTIRLGSQGMSVAYCQNLLNARIAQNPVLWVDGIFGPKTDQRVRYFQAMKQLTPDGIVGPLTWAALEAGPPPIHRRPY